MQHAYEPLIESILERGYGVWDGFMDPLEVAELTRSLELRMQNGAFRQAGIGNQAGPTIETAIRGDRICWIGEDDIMAAEQVYLDKLKELIAYFNRTCYLGLADYEVHYAEYPVGAFYKRHLDRFRSDSRRKLSVVCYLNQEWQEADGGGLRLFSGEDTPVILPLGGRLVCFESDKLEHEVLPATRVRRSLTGWLRTR